jgi:hypothetical protein
MTTDATSTSDVCYATAGELASWMGSSSTSSPPSRCGPHRGTSGSGTRQRTRWSCTGRASLPSCRPRHRPDPTPGRPGRATRRATCGIPEPWVDRAARSPCLPKRGEFSQRAPHEWVVHSQLGTSPPPVFVRCSLCLRSLTSLQFLHVRPEAVRRVGIGQVGSARLLRD